MVVHRAGSLFVVILVAVMAWVAGCSAPPDNEKVVSAPGAPGRFEAADAEQSSPPDQMVLASYQERQVIRRGDLTVRVAKAAEAEAKARALVEEMGGFVESSTSENLTGQRPVVFMQLRVPANRFDEAIDRLAKLGTPLRRNVQGEDVTMQLVDLEARLKNLRAQEEALRAILAKATKVTDVLEVNRQLSEVRGEIERMDAERVQIKELVALSTIAVTFDESAVGLAGSGDPGWFQEGWASATTALSAFLRQLALVGVWLAVFSPLWLPFVLWITWLFVRSVRRARSGEAASEPPA
jgi:hypothetical protein